MKNILSAALIMTLAACSQTPQPAAGPVASNAPSPAASASALGTRHFLAPDKAIAMLPRYHWQLTAADDKTGQKIDALFARPDKPLQLDFTAHGIAISNTCNRMRASYSTAGSRIRIGALAATLMACPDPKLTALDKAAAQYFSGTLEFKVNRGSTPQLSLITSEGDLLLFNGIPTAATRYGSEGRTVFLEVAPDTKPCNHPLLPNAQCLYVRELHYKADGTRAGNPGAWRVLAQSIEGYTHKAGVHNVLRVKRYKVAHPPADGSSVAYVLDMVVESGPASH